MPAGRPTDYRPEYCEQVIAMGEQGYSVVEMCAELKVVRNTLVTEWPKANPEFLTALTHAKQLSQAWWERKGRDCLIMGPGQGTFNASVWSRSMAARFPEDWRENKGVELTGPGGGAVEVRQVTFVTPDGK
jgi:hypothetical protein